MLRIGLAAAILAAPAVAQTIYVNASAAGANDGTSWADAFTTLQPALQSALPGQAIWVAAGTYRPTHPGGSRAQTLLLPSGVEVYGGFAGDELTLAERKELFLSTLLSGDLNGDDGPGFTGMADNSYHVVSVAPAAAGVVLDGFVVLGGNADGFGSGQSSGAGLRLAGGATVRNVTVRENRAIETGGGVAVQGELTVRFDRCVFEGNLALADGGALHQVAGQLEITSSTFRGNRTGVQLSGFGGAVYAGASQGLVQGSLFTGNLARRGAGLYADSRAFVTPFAVDACTFFGNEALSSVGGGGIYSTLIGLKLRGTVLWGNLGTGGATFTAQIAGFGFAGDYCCIQGMSVQIATSLGAGNFAQDPLLVDPDGPDGVVGTADDDPSLSPGSPAIDAGSNDAVAGQALDLGLLPRIVDDPQSADVGSGTNALADVGAFEFHSLIGSGTELSLAAGGLVRLELQAGPALAGEVFIVLGTGSGTVPGLKFGGLELTLNPDPYFFHTLNEPSTLPLFHSIGTLDQEGVAETIFFMPPGIDPILAGLLLHHAGAVLDPSTYLPELTTTAFPLQLLF